MSTSNILREIKEAKEVCVRVSGTEFHVKISKKYAIQLYYHMDGNLEILKPEVGVIWLEGARNY